MDRTATRELWSTHCFGKRNLKAADKATFQPAFGAASQNSVKMNFPESAIVAIYGIVHLLGQSKSEKEDSLWTSPGNLVEIFRTSL